MIPDKRAGSADGPGGSYVVGGSRFGARAWTRSAGSGSAFAYVLGSRSFAPAGRQRRERPAGYGTVRVGDPRRSSGRPATSTGPATYSCRSAPSKGRRASRGGAARSGRPGRPATSRTGGTPSVLTSPGPVGFKARNYAGGPARPGASFGARVRRRLPCRFASGRQPGGGRRRGEGPRRSPGRRLVGVRRQAAPGRRSTSSLGALLAFEHAGRLGHVGPCRGDDSPRPA